MRKTNDEVFNDLLSQSKQGALMHAFLIEAIYRYGHNTLKAPQGFMKGHMVSEQAWRACAAEALAAFDMSRDVTARKGSK